MIFLVLNIALVALALYLYFFKNVLTYFKSGHLWLTWLAVGVITLMDELTSVFYAPAEAYRHIGLAAILFIPITSVVIRYLTTRMVQIAEILDMNHLKGGGVYNFSYLVLGPLISFIAVSSIMIDYILTAAISTVSAVESVMSFVSLDPSSAGAIKLGIELVIVWLVAGLNIIGIRENVRVTFGIFLITGVVLINLLVSGMLHFDSSNIVNIQASFKLVSQNLFNNEHGFFGGYFFFILAISNCILAYSGVESVLQTARLSETWQSIKKAYTFLALSVGLFIPFLSVIVLSSASIDFAAHTGDLITHYATLLHGRWFGILVCAVAAATLIMAVNTACVASSELAERVAHRYGFDWIMKTNRKASLYRIHIATAVLFSLIIIVTQGRIPALADMYAVGLVACFVINLFALLMFNYSKGTKEISTYSVRRAGTVILFIIMLSCFVYLCAHKPHGFFLWGVATLFCLAVGFYGTRRRTPELKEIAQGETPLDVVLYIAEKEGENVHIYFKRPHDTPQEKIYDVTAFITLFSPRQEIPPRLRDNHFRVPFKRASIFDNIEAILYLISYELPHKNVTVHFGWPTSSWWDRLSTGIMVFQFVRLPQKFPLINFKMERFKNNVGTRER